MSPDSTGRVSRLDSPLVGRDRPLGTLTTVFGAAATDRACHLVTVLGAAGVGKSRLVREFAEELGDEASVVTGRCLPYGEGITYWPLAEVVRDMQRRRAEPSADAIAAQLAGEPKADLIVAGVSEAWASAARRAARARRSSGPRGGSSRPSPDAARSWSCSTTSSGPSRRSSTWSST